MSGPDGAVAVRVGSARSVLLTILGELVAPGGHPVWTSSLLHVLTGMGIEERTARQAIDRAAAAGWLDGTRIGRNVRWALTPAGAELIELGARRVYSLSVPGEPWAGQWLVLVVQLPGDRRAVRKRLYAALKWIGFGNPTPGLWLSPHPGRQAEVAQLVANLDLADMTYAFVGPSSSVGLDDRTIVERAWDLTRLAEHYHAVLDRLAGPLPDAGDRLLLAHLDLVNEWQRFPFVDPQLPDELAPDWIGRRAAAELERRRATTCEPAHRRWREIVRLTEPEIA